MTGPQPNPPPPAYYMALPREERAALSAYCIANKIPVYSGWYGPTTDDSEGPQGWHHNGPNSWGFDAHIAATAENEDERYLMPVDTADLMKFLVLHFSDGLRLGVHLNEGEVFWNCSGRNGTTAREALCVAWAARAMPGRE